MSRDMRTSLVCCAEHVFTEITHTHTQSYYRLGVALQGLERYEDAMVAFAEGLAIDPKSGPLLSGATQTMLLSPLKGRASICCSN